VAARRLDGGEQFFARAIDYGYSKSADEAFRRWPREELLGDVVEVIRRYRPGRGGLRVERDRAGRSRPAPGVRHHRPGGGAGGGRPRPVPGADGGRAPAPRAPLYYRSAWFAERPPDVELNTGVLDPLLGRSYHQVAMASRSLHRSQDQGGGRRRTPAHGVPPDRPGRGRARGRDPRSAGTSEGPPRVERSLFEGVDTLLSQRAGPRGAAGRLARPLAVARPPGPGTARGGGRAVVDDPPGVRGAGGDGTPGAQPVRAVAGAPTLVRAQEPLWRPAERLGSGAHRAVGSARRSCPRPPFPPGGRAGRPAGCLLAAANVRVDVVADREWVVPGQTFRLELGVWNGGTERRPRPGGPLLPELGWVADVDDELRWSPGERAPWPPGDRDTCPRMPATPRPTTWTRPKPATAPCTTGPTTRTSGDFPSRRARARLVPGPLDGARRSRWNGRPAWIGVDRRAGEYHRPVKVVPAASVAVTPDLVMVPTSGGTTPASGDHGPRPLPLRPLPWPASCAWSRPPAGACRPARWPCASRTTGSTPIPFRVTPPAGLEPGEYEVRAVLATARGDLDLGFQVIDYPHITPQHLYAPPAPVSGPGRGRRAGARGLRRGRPDGVPEALDRLGVEWQALLNATWPTATWTRSTSSSPGSARTSSGPTWWPATAGSWTGSGAAGRSSSSTTSTPRCSGTTRPGP
jgi:hypothetical protein